MKYLGAGGGQENWKYNDKEAWLEDGCGGLLDDVGAVIGIDRCEEAGPHYPDVD